MMACMWSLLLWLVCCTGNSYLQPQQGFSATYLTNYYWFSVHKESHQNAEAMCRSFGGHLVWLDTPEEEQWLAGKLALIESISYWYLGLLDHLDPSGGHLHSWTSGTPVMYTNLAPGEPNKEQEECVTTEQPLNFRWADVTCDRSEAFICKMTYRDLYSKMAAFQGHKYYMSEALVSFREAQAFCEGIGACLWWTSNQEEVNFISQRLQTTNGTQWYIGLYSKGDDAMFWTNGYNGTMSNINITHNSSSNLSGTCYVLDVVANSVTSVDCSHTAGFVCKLTGHRTHAGHVYWISEEPSTRQTARQVCSGLGGGLATLSQQGQDLSVLPAKTFLQNPSRKNWIVDCRNPNNNSICLSGNSCYLDSLSEREHSINSSEQCYVLNTEHEYTLCWTDCNSLENFICSLPVLSLFPYFHDLYKYHISTTPLTYPQAQAFCLSLGADLVWVDSEQEMLWLADLLDHAFPGVPYWYLGLYDYVGHNHLDQYQWLSGQGGLYRYFDHGEPKYSNERCVTMERQKGYKWADVTCGRPEPFICKAINKSHRHY